MIIKLPSVTLIIIGILVIMLIASYSGEGIAASQLQQCSGYINYGQSVYGAVPYTGDCRYYFTGYSGYIVTISMIKSSYSLDPYLQLLDPYGNVEAFDDDSAGNSNSMIGYHSLRYSGTYTIVAGSYGNQSTGSFTLSLNR